MRAKRSKQYRKLMRQFCRVWNFREPYQVLVDAEIVKDASRFKMDLVPALERTLHGKVKPMITQCSMRHLYSQGSEPGMKAVIDYAKETFERRRCGHHPDEMEALSALECMSSFVVDTGKGASNRYVVASQDDSVRRHMRGIRGVPLIYISRSVMILEPMADASVGVVNQEERAKFKSELKSITPAAVAGSKRKRENDGDGDSDDGDSDDDDEGAGDARAAEQQTPKKKKKSYGPKGPNPLAAKKKKKKPGSDQPPAKGPEKRGDQGATTPADPSEPPEKKKRRRRHKKATTETQSEDTAQPAAVSVDV